MQHQNLEGIAGDKRNKNKDGCTVYADPQNSDNLHDGNSRHEEKGWNPRRGIGAAHFEPGHNDGGQQNRYAQRQIRANTPLAADKGPQEHQLKQRKNSQRQLYVPPRFTRKHPDARIIKNHVGKKTELGVYAYKDPVAHKDQGVEEKICGAFELNAAIHCLQGKTGDYRPACTD